MKNKRIILAGGTGFLGQALASHFMAGDDDVVVLTRHPTEANEIAWDGETLGEWTNQIEGAEAVINLAGRSVDCRYTPANRRTLIDSRVKPTRVLGEAMVRCKTPPRLWINASSATIYRHTLGPAWDESSTDFTATPEAGDAFSLRIIHEWEQAFFAPVLPATRRIALRTTMVLGHGTNSVFPVLRRLARIGLGGRMGSGQQFVSWVHIDDFCRAVEWLMQRDELHGPVNIASPNPVTNATMMRCFRELVGMPFGLPASRWMLEIGAFVLRTETELMLKSRRVVPGKLVESGFAFSHPTFAEAIADLAARSPRPDRETSNHTTAPSNS